MVFGPLEWENLQYELGFPALKLGISEMWSPVSMGLKTLGCISSDVSIYEYDTMKPGRGLIDQPKHVRYKHIQDKNHIEKPNLMFHFPSTLAFWI